MVMVQTHECVASASEGSDFQIISFDIRAVYKLYYRIANRVSDPIKGIRVYIAYS